MTEEVPSVLDLEARERRAIGSIPENHVNFQFIAQLGAALLLENSYAFDRHSLCIVS